jgi:hypothetical protein
VIKLFKVYLANFDEFLLLQFLLHKVNYYVSFCKPIPSKTIAFLLYLCPKKWEPYSYLSGQDEIRKYWTRQWPEIKGADQKHNQRDDSHLGLRTRELS